MTNQTTIQVTDGHTASEAYTVQAMAELAERTFPLAERVPGVPGEAFDLKSWHASWKKKHGVEAVPEPTHVRVEAVDEFQALIPWNELDRALFLYELEGQPLKKGHPIRLYVPDGSSECLNVKSVVKLWFLHDAGLGSQAAYGFKNAVSVDELKWKK